MIKAIAHSLVAAALLLAGCTGQKQATSQSGSTETTSTATVTTATVASPNISSATYDAAHARWADATMETLEQGHQLYTASCNRCHGYPDVQKYSEEKWPGIMQKMGRAAKLNAEQTELVTRYVIALRAGSASH